ncbi:MAG: molybdopterin molybdotransferase MoeA [Thermoplasmata archaeon]|nr:molybdopterin molybdotransferase MoeA [Thermoplasmata archaeon]
MKMRRFGRLISVEEAGRRLARATYPVVGWEAVSLSAAVGRVAARSYRAPRPVPRFSRATWDGYALRSKDSQLARREHPVQLRVVGEVYAEQSRRPPLRTGEAVAIATGGAVPGGADAVVIFEDVRESEREIELTAPVPRGNRIARPGDDFRKGQRLVALGEVLGPAALGALAATGLTDVRAFRSPRVAIVPNGNELVVPGRRLGAGQIYESNNLTLGAIVAAVGGQVDPVAPVTDDAKVIERTIRRALRSSDLVLVTGGSSVGEHDFLPAIFPRLGQLLFHGIAVRPGKPTLAVRVGQKLVIGMPGHPTSCLANGFWLLLPVLRRLAHLPGPGWIDGRVRLRRAIAAPSPGFAQVVPVQVDGGWASPTFRDSSAITSLAGVNAFALRPPGSPALGRGMPLEIRWLPPPLGALPARP